MKFGISTFVNDDSIDTVSLARAIEERAADLTRLVIAEQTHIPAASRETPYSIASGPPSSVSRWPWLPRAWPVRRTSTGCSRSSWHVPAGPFQMMDLVGLDVVLDIENHCAEEFPYLPKHVRELLQSYVDAGKLDVKTGEGFYTYPSGPAGAPA